MVTEHSNTVYNCAHCGGPAYFNAGHLAWFHYGTNTATPAGLPCREVSPVAVTLPAQHRVTA